MGTFAKADLSVVNPVAGRWEIVVLGGLTTSGQEFSQTVVGDVSFDDSGVTVWSGLPSAATTTIAAGSSRTVPLQVHNTIGVGRTFSFTSSAGDIPPVSAHIPAAVTELVTLKLAPTGRARDGGERSAVGDDQHLLDAVAGAADARRHSLHVHRWALPLGAGSQPARSRSA